MIAIVKYNAGNVTSVQNALKRLGCDTVITADEQKLREADKVIFPGVGQAGSAMQFLRENGLDVILKSLNQPVLGICLGQQLMCAYSEEGNVNGLGIFKTMVQKFPPVERVPQMGWNSITQLTGPLFKNIAEGDDLYFVHSYYAGICESTTAVCDYILPFSAALQNRNFFGTQFHPEKSGATGERILLNFLKIKS